MNTIGNKKRLPRYKRSKNPPLVQVQDRDMAILMAVGCEYRYLTTRQIHLLFFGGSMSQTRLRLTKLYHNGYLDRVHRPVTEGSGEAIYCLDRRGANVLASNLDVDRDRMFWQGKRKTLSQNSLEHALRVNDFRVAMKVACDLIGRAKFSSGWVDEQLLRDLDQKVKLPSQSDPDQYIECPLVADGFFGLEFQNGAVKFFMLELDLGTESNRRFGLKAKAYREYLRSGKYQEVFESDDFRVLVITPSSRRTENLMRTAREAGDKAMFWFTDMTQYTQEYNLRPEKLMDKIWRVPGDWFSIEEGWQGRRLAYTAKPTGSGKMRSLADLAGTT